MGAGAPTSPRSDPLEVERWPVSEDHHLARELAASAGCPMRPANTTGGRGRRPSPGAEVSALHGTRQGSQDPLAAPVPHAHTLTRTEPLHGQSILEVLRTRSLTAPAPGGDRRLSGEAHQVGAHPHRSDHEPHGSLPGVPRRRPGPCTGMHLRREGAHLHTCDLHCVHGQRRARRVPDRTVIGGQSRSYADTS
jgi:hypothetical protein